MALAGLSEPLMAHGLIHHSDRGCQYCCYEYVAVLKSRGVRISMTESGDPLENAVAERVNGLIKSEWLNNVEIKDLADCLCRVEKAINAYNNVRPHLSLNYQTPAQAHRQSGSQKRCWKTWSERRNERLHLLGELLKYPQKMNCPPQMRHTETLARCVYDYQLPCPQTNC